jgi:hypothetical protein
MSRRLIWFLVSLGIIIVFNVGIPILSKTLAINSSINTSISMAPSGYKALYLLIQRLQKEPVSLWQHSIMRLGSKAPHIIWMAEPGNGLFFDGASYAKRMRELIAQGNHAIVLVDNTRLDDEKGMAEVLKALNRWYGLSLKTRTLDGAASDLEVISHFPTRSVRHLLYVPPVLKEAAFSRYLKDKKFRARFEETPRISLFSAESAKGAQVLLETKFHEPLILRFKIGQGSLTIFPNSFFLGNGQLDKADNAPLAVALQEINGPAATLFEVYSSGFNENRDIITFLATGPGIALLFSLLALLVAFCVWVVCMPIRRQIPNTKGEPLRFTQEVFIDSLANHYQSTQDWETLYQKMAGQFKSRIERRYPGQPLEIQLERLAGNPFFDVSHDALSAVFAKMRIPSEKAFIDRSRKLLEIQRKVSRYEQ